MVMCCSFKEVGDAFQLFMRNLQSDINASSEKFGFVEYFEGSLRDSESKKIADSIVPENLQSLDPRRQKIIPINSYIATYADLPPSPSVEPELMQDFVLDLQQIAENQINRIDQESNELIQKHELGVEEVNGDENGVTSESDEVTENNDANSTDSDENFDTNSDVDNDSTETRDNNSDSDVGINDDDNQEEQPTQESQE